MVRIRVAGITSHPLLGHRGQRLGSPRVMPKTLVLTNDYPPRQGGIQSFVHALASARPPGSVVVYAPAWDGARSFRREAAVPCHPPSPLADAARARRPPPGPGDRQGTRLRHRPVRRGGTARPARPWPPPRRDQAVRRGHPRARGGLGRCCRARGNCSAGSVMRSTWSPTWATTSVPRLAIGSCHRPPLRAWSASRRAST